MHHLDVMTRGFQVETRTRIPAKKLHVRLTRIDASPSASARATAVLAAWDGFPAVSRASAGHAHVVMNGHVGNAREMRELYALPPAEPTVRETRRGRRKSRRIAIFFFISRSSSLRPPPSRAGPALHREDGRIDRPAAAVILALYAKRFEDKDGDPSDQPSTALTACEGEFVIRLRPTRAASRVKRRFLRTDSLCFSTAA
jgi:hypothetical protein